jgi:molybdopterin-guanine dinucleotide biosynthesis protein A
MHSLFRALEGRELDLASLGLLNDETFLNVNTPEDLVKARLHQNPE